MVQRTYYPEPETTRPAVVPITSHDPTHVVHGYTLDDLDRLTRYAMRASWVMAMPYEDRHQAAHHAIVIALYEASERPAERELVHLGSRGITAMVQGVLHTAGYKNRDWDAGAGSMPAFQRYWSSRPTTFENAVVERYAVKQILPQLKPAHREALVTLAVHDTYEACMTALGITRSTWLHRISRARIEFLAMWHEGEAPSRAWGRDNRGGRGPRLTRCQKAGHPYDEANTYYQGRNRTPVCRACANKAKRDKKTACSAPSAMRHGPLSEVPPGGKA